MLYHQMQQFDPMMEEVSLSLMKLYDRLGNKDPVVAQYHQLAAALQQEAGVDPGPEVESWYQEWKTRNI
ncbi:Bacterial transcriptional activator domain protein [compost metagenome]